MLINCVFLFALFPLYKKLPVSVYESVIDIINGEVIHFIL